MIFFNVVLLDVSGQDAVAVFAIISNIALCWKRHFQRDFPGCPADAFGQLWGRGRCSRVHATLKTALACALIFSLGCYLFNPDFPADRSSASLSAVRMPG